MKDAVAELETEHRLIQQVVAGMSYLESRITAGAEIDQTLLNRIVEFLRSFADHLHHAKEEALFFPALERRGVPAQGCPVGALLHEHTKGRALVTEFEQAIEASAPKTDGSTERLTAAMRALAELYPAHIWKEDYLLFPMSKKVLTADDEAELSEKFEELDRKLGEVEKRRFESLAEELSAMVLQINASN